MFAKAASSEASKEDGSVASGKASTLVGASTASGASTAASTGASIRLVGWF